MKNRRPAVVTLILAGLAVCGYYVFWRLDRSLTHVGRRVTTISPSHLPGNPFVIGSLTGDKVMAFDYASRAYYIIDMRSRAKTMLPNLDAALKSEPHLAPGELSPDGQWLSYYTMPIGASQQYNYVARVDGSQIVRLKTDVEVLPYGSTWSADSKGGVVIDSESGRLSRWRFSDPVLRHDHTPPTPVTPGTAMIGPIAGGYLAYSETTPHGLQFIRVGEDGGRQVIGAAQIPHDGSCIALSLSPNRRRLLWTVAYDLKPSKFAVLRKMDAWLHIKAGHLNSLWTSDLKGGDLREVGYVRADDRMTNRAFLRAGWMQDENRLWLVYDDSVWTVQAD